MKLSSVLSYLKEELSDISTDKKLYHYTNLPALMVIIKKGGLGGRVYQETLNKSGQRELCVTRNNLKYNPEGWNMSGNADNVKITLYIDRINSYLRGVKKPTPIDLYRHKNKNFDPSHNPKEERIQIGYNKIPIDSRFMKIEFIGKPSKWSLRKNNVNHYTGEFYDVDYKEIIKTIQSLPSDLLIHDKGYESTLRSLRSYIGSEKRKTTK